MRAALLLLALLAALARAHDDYQALQQPQELRSPCAERWERLSRSSTFYYGGSASGSSGSSGDGDAQDRHHHHARARPLALDNEPSELRVNLTVEFSRFESSYVAFNTRTYNGQIPAPTIKVCPGDTLVLRLANQLRDGRANVTNVHLHGMHVSPRGREDNVMRNVMPGDALEYEYHIREDHPAGTFWYHPHSHGFVNTQLQGMMAGVLVVVDRPGDFPPELAAMDDVTLIMQAVCVEKCHNAFDVLPDALRSEYPGAGGDMNMAGMDMNMDMGRRRRMRRAQMDMDMDMSEEEEEEEEEEDEEEDDEEEDDYSDEEDEEDEDEGSEDEDEEDEEDEEEEEEDEEDGEFPVDLWVDARAPPLNVTSLPTVFVNGQYLPEVHFVPGELKRLRFLNAIANNVAELVLPGCEMFVLAMDGVYRDAPKPKDVVVIPPGGRADLAVRCASTGVYFIETENSPSRDHLLGGPTHHRVPSQRVVSLRVLDPEDYAEQVSMSNSKESEEDKELDEEDKMTMELPATLPKRPEYMSETRGISANDIPSSNRYHYEFSVWTEGNNPASVYGVNRKPFAMDFVNHSMRVDEMQEWILSVRNYDSKGRPCDADVAKTDVTFSDDSDDGVVHESMDSGCPHSMNHPFHMHSTHVQVVGMADPSLDPDGVLFDIGDWRDTLPLFKSDVRVRFATRSHMRGKVFTHCHISSHADGGMAQLVEVVEK